MQLRIKILVATLAALPLPGLAQTPLALFNGRDLAGWVQRGGQAPFAVDGDTIVGTSIVSGANSFLCTERTFGDFILEFEFKADAELNSGVQFRSECFPDERKPTIAGKEIVIPAGRVHGYQVEIDAELLRDRMWTAGIYDEGRRGWLCPVGEEKGATGLAFSEAGRRLYQRDGWNRMRVEARGPAIRTWLNGELRAEIQDSMTPRGFIALQIHGSGKSKAGKQVRWRNLRLTELPAAPNTLTADEAAAGWRLLWDGRSSEGWRSAKADSFPAKGWEIQDGVLSVVGSSGAESAAGGDIVTRERFADFELVAEFKLSERANSGIKYLCQLNLAPVTPTGAKTATGSAIGLEFQILDDQRHPDAKLGLDGNRTLASLYDLLPAAANKRPNPIGEWNTARIVVRGPHVEHWLNGTKVLEYERGSADFRAAVARSKFRNFPGFGEWADGPILLQDHGDRVSYRSIKIRIPGK